MKIFIHALNSCGMRNVKVQQYRDFFLTNRHEIIKNPEDSDLVFVWTCAFRQDVRDNSLSVIKGYKGKKVIIGGCLPDINPELVWGYPVISWKDDAQGLKFLGDGLSKIPLTLVKPQIYDNSYISKFIQLYISEGCNFKCSYCSERLAFPPYRSFPEDKIVNDCLREVNRSGIKKVVLLADSVGEYGYDTGSNLPALIQRLLGTIDGIRIGIQGLNPYHFLKYQFSLAMFIRNGAIIHLQIPFQSASDRTLKLMNRDYSVADIEDVFDNLYRLKFTEFDTHIIVGFPGETEQDLEDSINFVIRHHPKYVMINKFMESPEIPASKFSDKVSEVTKEIRMLETSCRIRNAGIICNYEGGELSQERLKRMNNE